MPKPHLTLSLSLLTTFSAALLHPELAAQRRWSLGKDSAAIYERESDSESRPVDGVNVGTPDGPSKHTPLLLGSELDDRQLRPVRGMYYWPGVAPALAFDLELDGTRRVERRFPSVSRLGDIVCRVNPAGSGQPTSGPTTGAEGSSTARDPNTDVFVVEFSDDETAEDRIADPERAETLRHYHKSRIRGSMRITRHFDPERGLVDRFSVRATYDYTMNTGDGLKTARVELEESWKLLRVVSAEDQSRRAEIDKALGRATNALGERLARDDGPFAEEEQYAMTQGITLHALIVRSAMAANTNLDPALIAQRATELRARSPGHLRSLAEWIRTVSRLEVAPGEKSRVRKEVRAAAKKLLAAREPGREELHFPGHLGGTDSDPMTTAVGVEALLDAADSYAKVPDQVWVAAARAILATQSEPEPVRVRYTTGSDRKAKTVRSRDIAGWVSSYYAGAGEHGTPTAMSVAVLARLRSKLPKRDRRLLAEVDESLRRGLGFLAHHFTVRTDPSIVSNDRQYDDYWFEWMVIALRRNDVTLLEGRDWAFELDAWTIAADLDRKRASRSGIGGLPRFLLAQRPSVGWWEK